MNTKRVNESPQKQPASDALSKNIPEIMNQWENRALKEVSATFEQSSLILRNSLPDLLHSLVILITPTPRTSIQVGIDAAELLRNSKAHGRGRAEIPAYIMSQVILEYHILREVLFKFLEQNSEFTIQERETLTSGIEEAVNIAATEFALALREIQDQFMLAIAHDLKNPVTAAQAGAELILRSPQQEFTAPLAQSMIKSMKKMTEMIEDIHDTNRINAGHRLVLSLTECDLNAIVEDVISDMRIVHGDIFSVLSDGATFGRWNIDSLRRMLENILSNAVKYRIDETPITLKLLQRDQNAVISVHNQGTAIPVGEQAHLFSTLRWKTTGKTQKGWGLGLVLVKGIVDAFHGTIQVESTEDKGTTFTVTLPRELKSRQDERIAG